MMFNLIKQVFIVFLSISESLATKRLFLNDEMCMVRPTLIDTNLVEVKYYPFMSSSNRCTGTCDVLSPNICVPKETKNKYVKASEVKAMTEHISCDCKSKFNSTTCNSTQTQNNKTC